MDSFSITFNFKFMSIDYEPNYIDGNFCLSTVILVQTQTIRRPTYWTTATINCFRKLDIVPKLFTIFYRQLPVANFSSSSLLNCLFYGLWQVSRIDNTVLQYVSVLFIFKIPDLRRFIQNGRTLLCQKHWSKLYSLHGKRNLL